MPKAVDKADLELFDREGNRAARLRLSLLPSAKAELGPLMIADEGDEPGLERVQLLEDGEYRYALEGTTRARGDVWLEPAEMFSPDAVGALEGRMRVRLSTGRVPIRLAASGEWLAEGAVEVRSTKLGYLTDYRRMLDDLVAFGSEVVLQRFAPAEQRFRLDPDADATSAYQRFCFLRAVIRSERVVAALARLVRQPYVEWSEESTMRPPSRGIRAGRDVARALHRPGPRIKNPAGTWELLPMLVATDTFREDVDNVANRFVRFVLEDWRNEVAHLGDAVELRARGERETPTARRARTEIEDTLAHLDDALSAPMFKEVGILREPPGANQVLQRRTGYREIVEAYMMSRFAAVLSWTGSDDVFGAGLRNVATLYEYWVFIQIVRVLSKLSADRVDFSRLFHETHGGVEMRLKQGAESLVRVTVTRANVPLLVDIAFNRSFRSGVGGESWTRTMKPDCSLEISPLVPRFDEPVRLHLDAKYRVNDVVDLVGGEESAAHPEDLLKMHAYRDAIVRAVGAYVVYPGTEDQISSKYTELLPGLGAFPLRPGPDSTVEGEDTLRQFLLDALDHVASQATRRSRASYWEAEANRALGSIVVDGNIDWLRKPPADTVVLLGYAKSASHVAWIDNTRLYNLRADERTGSVSNGALELAANVLVLYGDDLDNDVKAYVVVGSPRIVTRDTLVQLGYPDPRGSLYYCLELGQLLPVPPWLRRSVVDATRAAAPASPALGAPLAVAMTDLMMHARD
jgi:predicted component of viral defense system (DUF524 family)